MFADPRELDPRTPLSDWVMVDTETTGLHPLDGDQLIEIGAARFRHGRPAGTFTTLVRPTVPVPSKVTALTGITGERLAGQPGVAEAMGMFDDWLQADDVVVAHNASFDMAFLDRAMREASGGRQVFFPHFYVDTLRLSRLLHPSERSHSVASLIHRYGVADVERHRALSDALQEDALYRCMLAEVVR